MSQLRTQAARGQIARPAPSRMEWDDEKLAKLDVDQLKSLLANLAIQRDLGRVTTEAALELEQRINARLPARAQRRGAAVRAPRAEKVVPELAGDSTAEK